MRKAPGTFGHVTMDYPVVAIMLRAADDYTKLAAEFDGLEKEFDKGKDASIMPKLFSTRSEIVWHGTVALVMAVTALDRIIYDYACHYLHHEDVEKAIRNMGFVKKWIFLPKEATGKIVDPNSQTIKQLNDLVLARNVIVHQSSDWITTENTNPEIHELEWPRFRRSALEIRSTYQLCISLLESRQ
jgi:hypothetical protein